MPKLSHEALVHLVRSAPEVVVELLHKALKLTVPVHAQPRVSAAELTDINFAEYRADAVLTFAEPEKEVLVVEVQGDRDAAKREVWPVYVAGLRVRWKCPVTLVVLAPNAGVAAWCRQKIDLGRGRCVLRPLVLGPREIPVIVDVEVARRAPELAVLSVAAHGREPGAEHIAAAAILASRELDSERAMLYPDFIHAVLGKVARKALEKLMQLPSIPGYQYPQSEFYRKPFNAGKAEGKAEGLIEGKVELLLALLKRRRFRVTAAVRERVEGCRDAETLMRWAERVLTARRMVDVFADDER